MRWRIGSQQKGFLGSLFYGCWQYLKLQSFDPQTQ
jgi:hypothetical protein